MNVRKHEENTMKSDREQLVHHKRIGILISIAGIVFAVLTVGGESLFLTYTGLAAAFGGLIYMGIHLRCPHCQRHWDSRMGIPEFCPHCGKRID